MFIPLLSLGNSSVKISLSMLGNGSVKRYSGNEYTCSNRSSGVFYAIFVVSMNAGE
jgi:hypothetical protein